MYYLEGKNRCHAELETTSEYNISLLKKEGRKIRFYYDNELFFEGWILDEIENDTDTYILEILDDYFVSSYGCTHCEVHKNGEWGTVWG